MFSRRPNRTTTSDGNRDTSNNLQEDDNHQKHVKKYSNHHGNTVNPHSRKMRAKKTTTFQINATSRSSRGGSTSDVCWWWNSFCRPKTLALFSILVVWVVLLFPLRHDNNESLLSAGRQTLKIRDGTAVDKIIVADPELLKIKNPLALAWDPFGTEPQMPPQTESVETVTQPKLSLRNKLFGRNPSSKQQDNNKHVKDWRQSSRDIRDQFIHEYGSIYGRSMLTKSIQTVRNSLTTDNEPRIHSIQALTNAIIQKYQNQESDFSWNILVIGNGAAAGYGNYRSQAYSHQLQRLLEPLFSVSVTNVAMDQSTEFPTVWCLESHYLRTKRPDMVIWDFTGSTPRRLEAVMRYLLNALHVSVLVVRYASPQVPKQDFLNVLQHYCPDDTTMESNWLKFDACLWIEDFETSVEPYLYLPDPPMGIQGWNETYGSGRKPNKQYHEMDHLEHQLPRYLTVVQHRWVAWTIAMPLLSAWQVAHSQLEMEHAPPAPINAATKSLPAPVLLDGNVLDPLIMGDSTHLDCYTSYEFVVRDSHLKDLQEDLLLAAPPKEKESSKPLNDHRDIHVPGNLPALITNARKQVVGSSLDLLKPKLAQVQEREVWMYDLDGETRQDKLRMRHNHDQQAFFGMPDWKIAYYGAYQSGVLKLNVPLASHHNEASRTGQRNSGLLQKLIPSKHRDPPTRHENEQTIRSLILCQSDSPMRDNIVGCSWANDILLKINGIPVESTSPLDVSYHVVASVRGGTRDTHVKQLCRRVSIPEKALLNSTATTFSLWIEVKNPRVLWHPRQSTPCSLSHVLLEHGEEMQDNNATKTSS